MDGINNTDTIVALSTPPGIGAIAVIRLSGKDAVAITDRLFIGKKLKDADSHTMHFGTIENNGNKIDEVVTSIYKNPKSYTGEDVIEISCHGSPFIQQQIIQLLISKGARLAKPGEFTLRAFLNGKLDLSQAEAVADLIAAQTQGAHDIALKQMRGGYSEELKKLRYELIHFSSLIELELDFSEEDVEFAERAHMLKLMEKINTVLNRLIRSFELGNVIKNGVNTVIAGRPNAGKSTLLNVLLNEERAIVSEIPGTTRDTIEEELNINGITFRLIDTAGLREAKDEIEKIGVERTMQKINESTLLLYVFDMHHLSKEELEKDLAQFKKGNYKFILVANKMDKGVFIENLNTLDPYYNVQIISSLEKTNIDELKKSIYHSIAGNEININDPIVSNIRHMEALQKTKETLDEVIESIENKVSGEFTALHIRHALNYLGEITGEVTNEHILDDIFRNFCIGK
ncbi:MAG: tRNA uridine-5-carboxymethylaminomethyl(34) synthesis GTPase MnmE [Fimbriimonadaceae bacterium]|nr:tRNA uridine-5-carboxymethylaminomethyl(34) synthesis GTPase MnmE [Chitinophagales bacterium]